MKNLIVCLIIAFNSSVYAQEWIPYRQPQTIIDAQPISNNIPPVLFQQPRIVYQWVPQYAYQPVLVEQKIFCCRRYYWTVQPSVYWVQQTMVYP